MSDEPALVADGAPDLRGGGGRRGQGASAGRNRDLAAFAPSRSEPRWGVSTRTSIWPRCASKPRGYAGCSSRVGYVPDKMFNATQGDRRLYFHSADGAYHLDIFIDRFVMSHELELGARLETEPMVLPAAELLLTKLQIAELNRKDAADTAMLLLGHELGRPRRPGAAEQSPTWPRCAERTGASTRPSPTTSQKTQALLDDLLPDGRPATGGRGPRRKAARRARGGAEDPRAGGAGPRSGGGCAGMRPRMRRRGDGPWGGGVRCARLAAHLGEGDSCAGSSY